MKKILTKSIIAAVVIEIIGAAVNLISYKANGSFLLAKQLYACSFPERGSRQENPICDAYLNERKGYKL